MPCCKCNRTGSCKGCACVKAGKPCANCLPSKLGSCTNSSSTQKPSTAPFSKAGKEFVNEPSRLFLAFASASALKSIALKAATVLPILLLQKPQRASKTKEHIACLERRLKSWKEGNLNNLLLEGRAIQRRLPKFSTSKSKENLARSFANLMFAAKCKAALDLLSNGDEGGILHLEDHIDSSTPNSLMVRDVLISKHPTVQSAHANCILQSSLPRIHIPSSLNQSTLLSFIQLPCTPLGRLDHLA